jgi:hypothetical protein
MAQNNESDQNEADDHQERMHWFDVMRAFLTYDEFLECDVSFSVS